MYTLIINIIKEYLSVLSNIVTIIISCIGIYIYFAKKEQINSIFRVLLNYSYQVSLSELKAKIEILNDYTVEDKKQKEKILNILSEIVGQINGNKKIKNQCSKIYHKMKNYIDNPASLARETDKRVMISELREKLRNIELLDYKEFIGGNL